MFPYSTGPGEGFLYDGNVAIFGVIEGNGAVPEGSTTKAGKLQGKVYVPGSRYETDGLWRTWLCEKRSLPYSFISSTVMFGND